MTRKTKKDTARIENYGDLKKEVNKLDKNQLKYQVGVENEDTNEYNPIEKISDLNHGPTLEYAKGGSVEKEFFDLKKSNHLDLSDNGIKTIIAQTKPTYEGVYGRLHDLKNNRHLDISNTNIEIIARKFPQPNTYAKGGKIEKFIEYIVEEDESGNGESYDNLDEAKWHWENLTDTQKEEGTLIQNSWECVDGTCDIVDTEIIYAKGGKIDIKLKDWYKKNYPTDELGEEMNDTNTFENLEDALNKGDDVYNTIGVGDSVIRERLFEHLAKIKGEKYEFIYQKWLGDGMITDAEIKSLYKLAKGGKTKNKYSSTWSIINVSGKELGTVEGCNYDEAWDKAVKKMGGEDKMWDVEEKDYLYKKGGEIKRFDRHESMPDETRDEISYLLNGRSEDFHPYRIIDTGLRAAKYNEYWNEKQRNELRNYLFGLYDGYNYSHTEDFKKVLSNLKKSDIKTGNRVEKLFNEVDKYPKGENAWEYAKGGDLNTYGREMSRLQKKWDNYRKDAGSQSVMIDDMPDEAIEKIHKQFLKEVREEMKKEGYAKGGKISSLDRVLKTHTPSEIIRKLKINRNPSALIWEERNVRITGERQLRTYLHTMGTKQANEYIDDYFEKSYPNRKKRKQPSTEEWYAKGGLVIEGVRFGNESEYLEDYLDNNDWEVIEKDIGDKGTKFTLSMKDVEYEQRVGLEDYLDNNNLKYIDSYAKGGLTPEDMPDDYRESGEIVMQYLEEENIGGEDRIDIATRILDNQRPNETISETISRLGIYAKGGEIVKSIDEFKKRGKSYVNVDGHRMIDWEDDFENYIYDRIDLDERQKIREDWSRKEKENRAKGIKGGKEMRWEEYLLKEVNKKSYAKGGEVKKKGNEILIGGIAGILLGIFLNK